MRPVRISAFCDLCNDFVRLWNHYTIFSFAFLAECMGERLYAFDLNANLG